MLEQFSLFAELGLNGVVFAGVRRLGLSFCWNSLSRRAFRGMTSREKNPNKAFPQAFWVLSIFSHLGLEHILGLLDHLGLLGLLGHSFSYFWSFRSVRF